MEVSSAGRHPAFVLSFATAETPEGTSAWGLVDEINQSFGKTLLNLTVMQARCPM